MSVYRFLRLVLGVSVLGSSVAVAVEPITIVTSTPLEISVHDQSAFDWAGFYAGVFGNARAVAGSAQVELGAELGINAPIEFYLVGAEVALSARIGGGGQNTVYGRLLARAGLIIGDNVLVYGAGGYGIDFGGDAAAVLAGAGLEFAINDKITLDARYLHGFAIDGGVAGSQISFGANFHF